MELRKQIELVEQESKTSVPKLIRVDSPLSRNNISMVLKRTIDVLFSTLALVILAPVFAAIAIAIKIDSPGPVIFAQGRTGAANSEFTLFKFRSMLADSDEKLHKQFMARVIKDGTTDTTYAGNGFNKMEQDPRITRVGRILRKTSLDELPQFYNILKGDMSLVGPRPAIPYEVDMYQPWQLRRLAVKPGLTGLWQVSGRSRTTFEQMVAMDIDYIENWSWWMDTKIFMKTVAVVCSMRDAC